MKFFSATARFGRRIIPAIILFGATVLLAPGVQATIINPFQLDGSEQVFGLHSDSTPSGESFVMGVTGRIDALELSLGFNGTSPANLAVSLIDMSGGNFLAAPELATVSVNSASLGAFVDTLSLSSVTGTLIDFSSFDVQASAGDVLGFKLVSDTVLPVAFLIRVGLSNQYADGSFFSSGVITVPDRDAAFKVFVSPVPEPATALLFAAGLAGLAGMGWRRSRDQRLSLRCRLPA